MKQDGDLSVSPTTVRSLSRLTALTVAVIASLTLIGWLLDITILKSIRPEWSSMRVVTAICLILSAIALAWVDAEKPGKRRLCAVFSLAVCVVAVLSLAVYADVLSAGRVPSWITAPEFVWLVGPTERMAAITALIFLGVGCALLLLRTGSRRMADAAHVLVLLLAAMSYLVLTGYVFNVPSLYDWLGLSVALHTGIAFCLLCLGIFCARPDTWLMSALASREAGGVMARRLLPPLLVLPLVIGLLRVYGERAELFESEVGVALVATTYAVSFLFFVWWSAKGANRQQLQTEGMLREGERRLRTILDALPVAVFLSDEKGNVIFTNSSVERIWGLSTHVSRDRYGEYKGRWLDTGKPVEPDQWALARTLETGQAFSNDLAEIPGRDGAPKIVQNYSLPIHNDSGRLTGVVVVTEDVTERTRALAEVVKAKEATDRTAADLARSNRDLEQFAYVASHDLQEPLRAVAGFMSLLHRQHKDKLDADGHEYIGYAISGAERMQALINDLLAYSRVGARGGARKPVNMKEALDAAVGNLSSAIVESHAVVRCDSLPTVLADRAQMVQLLQNLVGNALKFRGPRIPEIHVSARREEDAWLFGVRDNGIGIEAKYHDRIFLIFQRLHSRTEYPGTGIGLALCKKIVERHSGKIWFESQPGEGTTFFFTISDTGSDE